MILYNLPIQQSQCIEHVILGHFSGDKAQEIIVVRSNNELELFKLDISNESKLVSMLIVPTFSIIRSISPVRLLGSPKDLIVIGSDSGRVSIIEYQPHSNSFEKLHEETFGRTGCRRTVPGQHLAVEAKGRAFIIAACEKQKLVYILNRDSNTNKLLISSPLESQKSHIITCSIIGLDVGFENPLFASIEIDYESNSQKYLTYYELDLGLNHVTRKNTELIDTSCHSLISLPGESNGPGGLLLSTHDSLIWKNPNHPNITVSTPIPKRFDSDQKMIISSAIHRAKNMLFILIQTEDGDLFKVSLEYSNDLVSNITIGYFDTIPPAQSISILKSGHLFAASESGSNYLFHISGLDEIDIVDNCFTPRTSLFNLAIVDELESIHPIIDSQLIHTDEETPLIAIIGGRGPSSRLSITRYGLQVTELAVTDLPNDALGVWTLRKDSLYESFIIVSFSTTTIVLQVSDTVEQVSDTLFIQDTRTLYAGQMIDGSFVQIFPRGLRHIKTDGRLSEWKCPNTVTMADCNSTQLVLVFGSSIVYFILDDMGNLMELAEKDMISDDSTIECIGLMPILSGQKRSKFLIIGISDQTIRTILLDESFDVVTMQVLDSSPSSICIINDEMVFTAHIGLNNGLYMSFVMDHITGALGSNPRARFLGPSPVKLYPLPIQSDNHIGILALSTRPWLMFPSNMKRGLIPLFSPMLHHAATFHSEQYKTGMVSISGSVLRIMALEKLQGPFYKEVLSLRYTPRSMIYHPIAKVFVIIGSEMHPFVYDNNNEPFSSWSSARRDVRKWGSCIQIVDPWTRAILHTIDIDGRILCGSFCSFLNGSEIQEYFALGISSKNQGFIYTYKLTSDANHPLEFVHSTPIEEQDGIPISMCYFGRNNRLLVGIGNIIRMYDIGKKKLLRKCELRLLSCRQIVSITYNKPEIKESNEDYSNRIIIGDIQNSFHYLTYSLRDNEFRLIADDFHTRWITSSLQLDHDTMAGGDKFGNFFVTRITKSSSGIQEKPAKLESIAEYFIGDIIMSLNKTSLFYGATQVLLYTTLSGSIGILAPFISREDGNFFTRLEMHMRQEFPFVCGRSHLSFRSYYVPVKNVLDGLLIEQYNSLSLEAKIRISDDLDRTPEQISKRIDDLRASIAF